MCLGRELPCTFRQSSFGFASLCRSAIVSMIGGVCWLGGWDKCRVFFVVMLAKEHIRQPAPHLSDVTDR